MNSVLQQLYMMPSFRKGILEADSTDANSDKTGTMGLLFYLKVCSEESY